MAVDPSWLPTLGAAGFSIAAVETDDCANIAAGVWILALYMGTSGTSERLQEPSTLSVSHGEWTAANQCVADAAQKNGLPVRLFAAILATEAGTVGKIVRNTNGTYDIGPAQVNSSWLPKLARMGISEDKLLNDGCLNVSVGAWILAGEMNGASPADPADYWRRVGNYNSHTQTYNVRYQKRVWAHLAP